LEFCQTTERHVGLLPIGAKTKAYYQKLYGFQYRHYQTMTCSFSKPVLLVV